MKNINLSAIFLISSFLLMPLEAEILESDAAYVCCTPNPWDLHRLDCRTVDPQDTSRARCDDEFEMGIERILYDLESRTQWTDPDRRDWCEDRLSIADRGSPEQDCSWAGCSGACGEDWSVDDGYRIPTDAN